MAVLLLPVTFKNSELRPTAVLPVPVVVLFIALFPTAVSEVPVEICAPAPVPTTVSVTSARASGCVARQTTHEASKDAPASLLRVDLFERVRFMLFLLFTSRPRGPHSKTGAACIAGISGPASDTGVWRSVWRHGDVTSNHHRRRTKFQSTPVRG